MWRGVWRKGVEGEGRREGRGGCREVRREGCGGKVWRRESMEESSYGGGKVWRCGGRDRGVWREGVEGGIEGRWKKG